MSKTNKEITKPYDIIFELDNSLFAIYGGNNLYRGVDARTARERAIKRIETAISKAREAGRKKCAYCEKEKAEVCFDCAECKAEHV